MKRAVVLGARFGGLASAVWLRRFCSSRRLEVLVVDQWNQVVFRPGLIHAMDTEPWRLIERLAMPLPEVAKKLKIQLLQDTVVGMDADRRVVYTATHPPISYDVLFIATGSEPRWSIVPGLDPSMGGICEGFLARHTSARNQAWSGGDMVLAAGPWVGVDHWAPSLPVGFENPLIESALLFDQNLRQRRIREHSTLTLVTSGAQIGANLGGKAGPYLRRLLEKRDIHVIANAEFERVTSQEILLRDRKIPYHRAVWLPPQGGAGWLRKAGIDDGHGWLPVNEYLRHPKYPDIYGVGNIVGKPWPKMGHSAMVQARVAVSHWHAVQNGRRKKPRPYRPKILWVMESGFGQGLMVLTDVFYGGQQDTAIVGFWPKMAKTLFQSGYIMTGGVLPFMP